MSSDLFSRLPDTPPPWDRPGYVLLNRKASRNSDQFVYLVDGDAVVKTYAPRVGEADLRHEWRREDDALRALAGLGLAEPRLR